MGQPLARRLTAADLEAGCRFLGDTDPDLARLLDRNGLPPLRLRRPGFATLVHLVLQQQVSRASAQAVFDRLQQLVGHLVPERVLEAAPDELRSVGFSHQKIDYVRTLAQRIESGDLPLDALVDMPDDAAIATLVGERGIGPWTASVYVLTALGRPDVWAPGDRALLVSMGRMLGREDVPDDAEAAVIADRWRPWRAVAARILWHDYSAAEMR